MQIRDLPITEYTDYGPRPTADTPVLKRGRWVRRPLCEGCGPFRGRYLRREAESGGYICRGCDNEN